MRLKVSYRGIGNFICAFAGILSMNPYFVWPTFMNGILTYGVYIVYLLASYVMIKRCKRFTKSHLMGIVLLFSVFCVTYLHSYGETGLKTILGGVFLFLYFMCFCCLDDNDKKDIFVMFTKLFVISLIPGLFYFILELLGVSLSIGTINSQNQLAYSNSVEYLTTQSTGYYKLYLGAVMRVNANTRFAGIYDEAGLVGTVAALCLVAYKLKIKEKKLVRWLLFFAIISFSLAGYLLLVGYYLLSSIRKGRWKLPVFIVVAGIAVYILLTIQTSNPMIANLQSRIQFTGNVISIVNNRETSQFDVGYSQLLNGSLLEKAFGFGRGASAVNKYMNGSSSYKCYIFNYGYVGFGLMILTLVYCYKKYLIKIWKSHWDEFVLLAIFLISVYQRPSIYFPYYFIILFGGAAYIVANKYDTQITMSQNF